MESIDTIRIKITLNGIKPEIWRRLIIDSSYSLQKLHNVIQVAVGWAGSHLYEFFIREMHFGVPSADGDLWDDEIIDSRKKKLKSFHLRPREKFKYIYDFGDYWEHAILVEKVMKIGPAPFPICLEGARNCPPEDCGSIPGYEEITAAMKNPKSKEAKEFIDWLGGPYDSEEFNINQVNSMLKEFGKTIKK